MEIFRFSSPKWAGSRTASGKYGRWNYDGQQVIYCAGSRSLAALEIMVHSSRLDLDSTQFAITIFRVPNTVSIKNVNHKDLPDDWNGLSPYRDSQPLGSEWYESKETTILRVPSSIVVNEFNYLISVNLEEFKLIEVVDTESFIYDPRLLEKIT